MTEQSFSSNAGPDLDVEKEFFVSLKLFDFVALPKSFYMFEQNSKN